MKATFNTEELHNGIKFIGSLIRMYNGTSGGADSSDVVLLEATKESKRIVYANKGIVLKVELSDVNVEDEGVIVCDPYYIESLPNRAKVTTLELIKEKDVVSMKYSNGASRGKLAVTTNKELIENHYISKETLPKKFSKLRLDNTLSIINTVSYDSFDMRIDKKMGIPIRFIGKDKNICVQSGDGMMAVTYKDKLKEPIEDLSVFTNSLLLKTTLSFFKDDVINFSSNEQFTRLKNKKYDIVVPTQQQQLADISSWIKQQGKPSNTISFENEKALNALSDAVVTATIAKDANPNITFDFKDGKCIVYYKAVVGKSQSTFKCDFKNNIEIMFNSKYFNLMASKLNGSVVMDIYKDKKENKVFCVVLHDKEEKVSCVIPTIAE